MKTVSIIGLRDIGLPIAIAAAEAGWTVYGYDGTQNRDEINEYSQTKNYYSRFQKVLEKKLLQITQNLMPASFYIITLNNMYSPESESIVEAIGAMIRKNDCIIFESFIGSEETKKYTE